MDCILSVFIIKYWLVSFASDVFIDLMFNVVSCFKAEIVVFGSFWLMYMVALETTNHI